MPKLFDYVSHLSQEVGARPAGTEEERQAALYVQESFSKEAGLQADLEDFNAQGNPEILNAALAGVSIVCSLVGLMVSVLAIPMFLLTVAAAVLFFLEKADKPVLSRLLARGVSQNVVAKYQPPLFDDRTNRRRRKIILVANYDSMKSRQELGGVLLKVLPAAVRANVGAMAFLPFLMLLRLSLFAHAEGVLAIILNVLTFLVILAVALPLIFLLFHRFAQYNEGANCNASGVAALIEVATRLSQVEYSPEEYDAEPEGFGFEEEPAMHGEDALLEAGVVPEGAQLHYEEQSSRMPQGDPEGSAEERLLAAKAAIAALSGREVSKTAYAKPKEEEPYGAGYEEQAAPAEDLFAPVYPVAEEGFGAAAPEAASAVPAAAVAAPAPVVPAAPVVPEKPAVPDWYAKAQAKAKKPAKETVAQRSRYADALDAAVSQSSAHMNQATAASQALSDRLASLHDSIAYVAPPVESLVDRLDIKPVETQAQPEEPAPAATAAASAEPVVEDPFVGEEPAVNLPEELESFTRDLDEVPDMPDVDTPAFLEGKPEVPAPQRTSVEGGEALQTAVAVDGNAPAPAVAETPARPGMQLPTIGDVPSAAKVHAPRPSVSDLRSSLPSLSGEISKLKLSLSGKINKIGGTKEDVYSLPVQNSQEPLEEELDAADVQAPVPQPVKQPEEPQQEAVYGYEDDLDPYASLEEEEGTEYEGEAQEKRGGLGGFFGRFGRKKKEDRSSSYDAGWLDDEEEGGWNGGAFSLKDKLSGAAGKVHLPKIGKKEDVYEETDNLEDVPETEQAPEAKVADALPEEPKDASSDAEEEQRLQSQAAVARQFRAPHVDSEVWFVALGAEEISHSGIKAFIAQHASKLRGSIIIQLDGLGAGTLTYVEEEGAFRTVKSSSRMKRLIRKATQTSGISPETTSIKWQDSTSSYANSHGCQALHLAGMEGGKPAFMGQEDDMIEKLDEDLLYDNVDFVCDLMSAI